MATGECRVCGCTEDDACVDDSLTPCRWVEIDLCSACGDSTEERLRHLLCCCGSDHEVRAGGLGVNLVQTAFLAEWPYMTVGNVLVPESKQYPLATAVVCDQCIEQEPLGLMFVVAGEDGPGGEIHYRRVPVAELKKPAVYWPDLHPDNLEG